MCLQFPLPRMPLPNPAWIPLIHPLRSQQAQNQAQNLLGGWAGRLDFQGRVDVRGQVQKGIRLMTQEEQMLQLKCEGQLLQNSLLLTGGQSLVLFRLSNDWIG